MRLCFATVLADEAHLLLLDESTNHVDIETLDSMSRALNDFEGAVLMVSHNQAFLSGFCKELWVLDDGHVTVNHSDTESFDEIFSQVSSVHSTAGRKVTNYSPQRKGCRGTACDATASWCSTEDGPDLKIYCIEIFRNGTTAAW